MFHCVHDISLINHTEYHIKPKTINHMQLCSPECPPGTYKPTSIPGDITTCIKCPDSNHISKPGSTSVEDCYCKRGYQHGNGQHSCKGDRLSYSRRKRRSLAKFAFNKSKWRFRTAIAEDCFIFITSIALAYCLQMKVNFIVIWLVSYGYW